MIFAAWTIKDAKLFRALSIRSETLNSVIALRLSVYLYCKYLGIPVIGLWAIPFLTSLTFWRKLHPEIEIDPRFYLESGITSRYLETAFCRYIRKLNKCLIGRSDVVFLTGTSRLSEQAIRHYFTSSKVIYWEAGIKGTIYMSKKGVNADAEFRNLSNGKKSVYSRLFSEVCIIDYQSRVSDAPIFEFFSKLVEGIYLLGVRYIFRNREVDELLNFKIEVFGDRPVSRIPKKDSVYYLYIDQVEQDTNYTHFGCSAEEVADRLNLLMATDLGLDNVCLVRRAHPRQAITRVSQLLKSRFLDRYFDYTESSLNESIMKSRLVITVNSTAAIEALLLGKPTLVLGSSYFDHLYGVLSLEESVEFVAGRLTLDDGKIKSEVSKFLESNFIPIDFRGGSFFVVNGFDDFVSRIDH
jgi:hypothetical protein